MKQKLLSSLISLPFLFASIFSEGDYSNNLDQQVFGICSSHDIIINDTFFKIHFCTINELKKIKCTSGKEKSFKRFSEIFPYFIDGMGNPKTLEKPLLYWFDFNNDVKVTEDEIFLNNNTKEFNCREDYSSKQFI